MLKKLVPMLLLLSALPAAAQRIMINGQETSRLLTWEDFTGRPDKTSPWHAFTYWNITTRYDAFNFKGDTAKWNVIVTLEFGKNSWQKKDKVTDTLLKHEQGHFDVGILCAMELDRRIRNTAFFRSNYQAKLNELVKEVIDKYIGIEKQYDSETDHFTNREQQWKWDAFFASRIKKRN
jgi:hypothetical protein